MAFPRTRIGRLEEDKSAKQLIDTEILCLLRGGSQTLYSIKRELFNVFAEDRSFGTIHPHLVKLEEHGLIRGYEQHPSENGPFRRPYGITRKGRAVLEKQVNLLTRIILKMAA